MYKELTIENIKTFEKEQKLKIAPMTLIYGENSSGKTTLLKTFDIVHNIFAEAEVKRGKNITQKSSAFWRNENIQNISARKIHFFSSQINKKPIKIELTLDLPYDFIGQNHPLYSTDRDHVNRLLLRQNPNEEDLVDIARLFMRYEDFPGAEDLKIDLEKVLKLWGLNKNELHSTTRKIWEKDFRPDNSSNEIVGSSFDTSENSVN